MQPATVEASAFRMRDTLADRHPPEWDRNYSGLWTRRAIGDTVARVGEDAMRLHLRGRCHASLTAAIMAVVAAPRRFRALGGRAAALDQDVRRVRRSGQFLRQSHHPGCGRVRVARDSRRVEPLERPRVRQPLAARGACHPGHRQDLPGPVGRVLRDRQRLVPRPVRPASAWRPASSAPRAGLLQCRGLVLFSYTPRRHRRERGDLHPDLNEDDRGVLWGGGHGVLIKGLGDTDTAIPLSQRVPPRDVVVIVRAIQEDRSGSLWIGDELGPLPPACQRGAGSLLAGAAGDRRRRHGAGARSRGPSVDWPRLARRRRPTRGRPPRARVRSQS